jgi:hypothetical protein
LAMTCEPMSPLPPITRILMMKPSKRCDELADRSITRVVATQTLKARSQRPATRIA